MTRGQEWAALVEPLRDSGEGGLVVVAAIMADQAFRERHAVREWCTQYGNSTAILWDDGSVTHYYDDYVMEHFDGESTFELWDAERLVRLAKKHLAQAESNPVSRQIALWEAEANLEARTRKP